MTSFLYFCEKCNYGTNIRSSFDQHVKTTLHQTGKRKERCDKTIYNCDICEYTHCNRFNFSNHVLNNHSTKEERQKGFTFYCNLCDFGTFAVSIFDKHKLTDKHKSNNNIKE